MRNKTSSVPRFLLFGFLAAACILGVSCDQKKEKPKTRLQLNTVPEGATVTMLGVERGKTPLKFTLLPTTYIIKFSMEKYKTRWERIEVAEGESKVCSFKLEPECAAVMIISNPEGATVEFQGKKLGATPVVIPNLPYGSYTAEISRHGYSRRTAAWEIKDATPQLVKVDMTSNQGTLEITSNPSGAEVLLNETVLGKTPLKEAVEEGKHSLSLRKDGYQEFTRSITVRSGQTTTLRNLALEIKPSSLAISSVPSGAKIYVNEKQYDDTPSELKGLLPGVYAIRLEKAGFDPATRTVNLPAGTRFEVALSLDSNTGGVDIVTQPGGLTVYLDGKLVGVTEADDANPGSSKVFSLRNLSMGTHQLTVAHKRGKPEKRTRSFEVKKGEVVRLSNLSIWIPNIRITFKEGNVETGRLAGTLSDSYLFEPEPGVRYTVKKTAVSKLEHLQLTE